MNGFWNKAAIKPYTTKLHLNNLKESCHDEIQNNMCFVDISQQAAAASLGTCERKDWRSTMFQKVAIVIYSPHEFILGNKENFKNDIFLLLWLGLMKGNFFNYQRATFSYLPDVN